MKRKKINVIHIITQPVVGGAQENTVITVQNLNNEVFNPIVLSGEESCNECNILREIEQKNIPYFSDKYLVRSINPIKDLLCLFSLIRFIKVKRGTIVHTHSSKAGILGRVAAHYAGSKIIIHTAHGWSYHRHLRKWKKFMFVLLERLATKFTDKLICVTSRDVKKGLQERIGEKKKYIIIRSGFDAARFRKKKSDVKKTKREFNLPIDKKVVGTVGRLLQQKDHETFIRVAHLISKQRDDVIFVIVGEGGLRSQIEKMINNLNLQKNVYLLGEQKKVERIFSVFDIFLLTSLWEGLPKVIPQAMASGIPVVSTAVDGVKEVIKHNENGFLSLPGDAESLAKNVVALLDNEGLRKEFVFNSSPIVEQFDASLMVKEIENLYLELIQNSV